MKFIPLPHGLVAIVDDDDFERCMKFRWHISSNGYVVSHIRSGDRSDTKQLLSRFVTNAPNGVLVDHKDGNKFDNRKAELRFCTKSQNGWNRGKNKNNTSGFKGVSWDRFKSKWKAQIQVHGKNIYIGRFNDIEECAAAYAEAALKYHGEFSRT